MSTGPKNKKPENETPAQKARREAKDAELRRTRYGRAISPLLLAFLAETGGWKGRFFDLVEALWAFADEKQRQLLPDPVEELEAWEIGINAARSDAINLGWSFFPKNLSLRADVSFFPRPDHWENANRPHPFREPDVPVVVDAGGTPTGRTAEAIHFARNYKGSFGFMLEMKKKARNPNWSPSPNQVTAILKSRAYAHAR